MAELALSELKGEKRPFPACRVSPKRPDGQIKNLRTRGLQSSHCQPHPI